MESHGVEARGGQGSPHRPSCSKMMTSAERTRFTSATCHARARGSVVTGACGRLGSHAARGGSPRAHHEDEAHVAHPRQQQRLGLFNSSLRRTAGGAHQLHITEAMVDMLTSCVACSSALVARLTRFMLV